MARFRKEDPLAPRDFFEAEAAGLRWLADAGGARVAEVHSVGPGWIEIEHIERTAPIADAARAFGEALARTHLAGAPAFGASPAGWNGPLFIGSRQMPNMTSATWGVFYAQTRVLPFLDTAVRAGHLTSTERDVVHEACSVIEAGAFDDDEPPARIHGDLWAGNVLFSPTGVVLIDPAAHGGHRETDVAMLALFGAPYLDEMVSAYDRTAPLRAGWQDRIAVHQLHPLAVHAAGHGRSYGLQLVRAAQATLALAS